mgnify:CR=1 FL=1
MKEQNPDKFELLKDVYFQLFPDIEDVIVKQFKINGLTNNEELTENLPFVFSNNYHVLFVKEKNLANPVNFSIMSDGAKRVFMILTKIIVSSVSNISLIAIEEPENSVHPGLFQAYIQIISQLLDDCKVIITSHSPYIISYLNPSWIHVGVNRQAGVAEFFSFKKSGQKQLENERYITGYEQKVSYCQKQLRDALYTRDSYKKSTPLHKSEGWDKWNEEVKGCRKELAEVKTLLRFYQSRYNSNIRNKDFYKKVLENIT